MEPATKKEHDAGQAALDVTYTPAEYLRYAEGEARKMLNVSLEDALGKLDRGELEGTLAEVRLKLIRAML
jgi:hypothetical protein